jgi:hypothetical protein
MRERRYAGRYLGPVAGLLMLTGALAGFTPAHSPAHAVAACQTWTAGAQPPPVGIGDHLNAVTVRSASDTWAVGTADSHGSHTLIEHWSGSSWSLVPSSTLFGGDLLGVSAASPASAWAVGSFLTGKAGHRLIHPLILHWNGTAWTSQAVRIPGGSAGELNGVRAVSATDIWAVGDVRDGNQVHTLILHSDGTAWQRVNSPSPGPLSSLDAVTASSATSAWAVGNVSGGSRFRTLILRWNGTTWSRVTSPNPNSDDFLADVSATSASNAWAAGFTTVGGVDKTLVLRWNGTSWRQVTSPSPGGSGKNDRLVGVTATSSGNAWAVGSVGALSQRPLILHWDGTGWRAVSQPRTAPGNMLDAVAASSPASAWAVGSFFNGTATVPLALHCG